MPVTRSTEKRRLALGEPPLSSSSDITATSHSARTETTAHTAMSMETSTTTETTTESATTSTSVPAADPSVATQPSTTCSVVATEASGTTVKQVKRPDIEPLALPRARQDELPTEEQQARFAAVNEPQPPVHTGMKCTGSTTTKSKTKAQRLARARAELARCQVRLTEARMAMIELEDSDEEDDISVYSKDDVEPRVKQQVPASQQVPTSHQQPTVQQVPASHQAPIIQQVPTSPHVLTNLQASTVPQVQMSYEVPTVPQVPVNYEVYTAPQVHTSYEVPAGYRVPTVQQVHASQQVPTSQQQQAASIPAGVYQHQDFAQLSSVIISAFKAASRTKFIDLPVFSGNYQEWLIFRAAYYETMKSFTKFENSNRLRRSLEGKAREAVEGLLISNSDPAEVMNTLESRFGKPEAIALAEINALKTLPRLTENPQDTCTFSSKITNVVSIVRALGCAHYLCNPEASKAILEKLTPTLRHKYYEFAARQPRDDPELQKIEQFMRIEAALCAPYAEPEPLSTQPQPNQQNRRTLKVHTVTEEQQPTVKCPVCSHAGHSTTDCDEFKIADNNTRWDIAKNKKLCFRCLRYRTKNHSCKPRDCGINGCKCYHNRKLHFDRRTEVGKEHKTTEADKQKATEAVNTAWTPTQRQSYLKIIPIRVRGPAVAVDTYALLDDGSTVTLIDSNISEKIGATGPVDPLRIEAINKLKTAESQSKRVNIVVRGLNNHEERIQARTVKNLQVSAQRVPIEQIKKCEHLRDLSRFLTYEDAKPRVLIGQDNWHLLLTSKIRTGDRDQPVASLTPLGWVLHGSQTRSLGRGIDFVSHITEVQEEDNLDEMVKQYFNTDALCLNPKKPSTDPEEKALRILTQNTVHTEEGRYETALLWKKEDFTFQDNYDSTVKRLMGKEKKLERDPSLKKKNTEQIEDSSKVHEWRWVPTKLNVDDDATRDVPAFFDTDHRWFKGPEFLYEPEDVWPKESALTASKPTGEERINHVTISKKQKLAEGLPEVSRFSNWERLRYSAARVLQFIQLCRARTQKVNYRRTKKNTEPDPAWNKTNKKTTVIPKLQKTKTEERRFHPVSAEDLIRAEELLMRSSQENSFAEEIEDIQKEKIVKKESRLHQLSVEYVDGFLRLRSRIEATAEVTDKVKSPMVIDGNHPTVKLWIKSVHIQLHHAGVEATVNECRQQYWVLRLRPTARTIVRQCLHCRMKTQAPPYPRTGNLPPCRLAHHRRPFTFTGVDYFGPLTVTVGRAHQKRYVAIFTCLTSRAIHLELANSLSTSSAIMALRRMIARRGCPTQIWSDNGTNLKGADKELRQAIYDATAEEAAKRTISWRYIPPGAPFMGGAWERMVRSVKTALTATLHERSPTEEVLTTLLTEVEYTVNSRPLTHVSVSADDPEALTPNHLLLGGSGRVPIPGNFNEKDTLTKNSWRAAQRLADVFWTRWLREYLPELQNRREPHGRGPEVKVGDLVQLIDPNLPRNVWVRGKVIATYPGPDSIVRTVDIKTKGGVLRRPVRKMVILPVEYVDPAPATDVTRSHGGRDVQDDDITA